MKDNAKRLRYTEELKKRIVGAASVKASRSIKRASLHAWASGENNVRVALSDALSINKKKAATEETIQTHRLKAAEARVSLEKGSSSLLRSHQPFVDKRENCAEATLGLRFEI